MKLFKEKILWQIIPILIIILVPTFGFLAYVTSAQLLNIYLEEQGNSLVGTSEYVRDVLFEYEESEWLIKYWFENADTLDVQYDSPEALAEKVDLFEEKNPEISLYNLPSSDFAKLDDESKKLYAELCFMESILTFDSIKEKHDLLYFYLSRVDNDDMTFILSGAKKGETRGDGERDIYKLGKRIDVNIDDHVVLKDIVENHSSSNGIEARRADNGLISRYNVYIPVMFDDDSAYVICACLSVDKVNHAVDSRMKKNTVIFISVLIAGIFVLVGVIYLILLRPIEKLQAYIRNFKETKDTKIITEGVSKLKVQNEMGRLADDVSTLAVELVRHTQEVSELAAENKKIETELSVATRIQTSSLPNVSSISENQKKYSVFASMDPAKEVGGDFYDFFYVDDDHVGMVMADVSGKGIPAAMFMMISMMCINNVTKAIESPAKVLEYANNALSERNDAEMFLTVWLGILELSTGKLISANAGHEYPAICRKNGEFELIKTKHGLALAAMPGMKYKEEEMYLNEGDIIYLYTDGVAEATDENNNLYGTKRLLNVLNDSKALEPMGITLKVRADIDKFVGNAPQFDDITMMCFKFNGTETE